jgi:hypothetical protein
VGSVVVEDEVDVEVRALPKSHHRRKSKIQFWKPNGKAIVVTIVLTTLLLWAGKQRNA